MQQISDHSLHEVKQFSQNHKEHRIILSSYDDKSSCTFEASLSLDKMQEIITYLENKEKGEA